VGINSHSVSTTLGPQSITVTAVNRAPIGNLEQAVDSVTATPTISQSTGTLFVSGWQRLSGQRSCEAGSNLIAEMLLVWRHSGKHVGCGCGIQQLGMGNVGYVFTISASG